MKPFKNWEEAADHIISYHTFEFPIDLISTTNSLHIPIEYRDFDNNLNVTNYIKDDRMIFVVPNIPYQLSQVENYYYRVSFIENLYEFIVGDDNETTRKEFVKEFLMPSQYVVGHVLHYCNPDVSEMLSIIFKFWEWFKRKPNVIEQLQMKLNLPYSVVADRIDELYPKWRYAMSTILHV